MARFNDDPPLDPYNDGTEDGDGDLWFLPPDPEDEPEVFARPQAADSVLFPYKDWRAAEAEHALDLALLSFDFGRLEERLRSHGEGARRRLALQEVASLGWWSGDRLPADRLVLWISLQIGATGGDAQALSRGAWAVRRLTSGPAPIGMDRREAMSTLLGLNTSGPPSARVSDACDILDSLSGLHPVVQSAVLFHLWRLTDPSPARDLEAAVLAARLGGAPAAGQGFLPLSLAGFPGLVAQGDPGQRLAAWISGAHQAVLAALMHLDRLAVWNAKAAEAISDLSGRTPPRLLGLLRDWPSVSAPMAEQETGASRAAVQRNLDLFAQRGLIRELTGRGRYRVWTALLG